MKNVMQKYLHQPEKGITGDCWRACIASITDVDIENFPNPNDYDFETEWSIYWTDVWEKLQTLGFDLCIESVHHFKGNGKPVIASGKSPRGEFNHAIVWNNGIIHDPHPDNTGICNIDHFEVIEKL